MKCVPVQCCIVYIHMNIERRHKVLPVAIIQLVSQIYFFVDMLYFGHAVIFVQHLCLFIRNFKLIKRLSGIEPELRLFVAHSLACV